ncbi:hypothetical protein HZF05_10310 [Sphingomonas sp. CGMCC 1.13654]|uniref:Uncharacterized protein n=1 Tax=Sphingomonas chungangi TaxID=2683589 RepID=A0A838L7K0_9SPHN|nr:hypothetical protein [Sphingomonas chungangi]MBA2934489.1 hypothetical protein [Sphingomonas chungangi]MVW57528.1 hypothetical protein [Sphingomonas chungangi]
MHSWLNCIGDASLLKLQEEHGQKGARVDCLPAIESRVEAASMDDGAVRVAPGEEGLERRMPRPRRTARLRARQARYHDIREDKIDIELALLIVRGSGVPLSGQ